MDGEPKVYYGILDKDKKPMGTAHSGACFGGFLYNPLNNKIPVIGFIHYQIQKTPISVSPQEAIDFYDILRSIGFVLKQDSKDILKNGYLLELSDLMRDGNIYASEVGAHLTLIRYAREFPGEIRQTLALMDIDPTLDKWMALQLAHVFKVEMNRPFEEGFGDGHRLFSSLSWKMGYPYKSWDNVIASIKKSHVWEPMFAKWDINRTYGHTNPVSKEDIINIQSITISNKASLQKAIKCLISISPANPTT